MKRVSDDSPGLRLLVRVLAQIDATFWPIRRAEWEHPKPTAIRAAQDAFQRHRGVIVPSPGTDAERKAAERLVDSLIQSGYLKALRRGRGRFLRLSATAEDRVRQLCGLPGLWLSFETVRRYVREAWTPEVVINDGRGWGDGRSQELHFVELLMLPALVRGVVVAGSDVQGHVYYRRVQDVPSWPQPAGELELLPELARYYYQEAVATRERILATDVGSLEIGELPLPCSMEGSR